MAVLFITVTIAISAWKFFKGDSVFIAWLKGFAVIPIVVIWVDYLFPNVTGGGASFFPLSLVFGSAYAAVTSAVGLLIGFILKKRHESKVSE